MFFFHKAFKFNIGDVVYYGTCGRLGVVAKCWYDRWFNKNMYSIDMGSDLSVFNRYWGSSEGFLFTPEERALL